MIAIIRDTRIPACIGPEREPTCDLHQSLLDHLTVYGSDYPIVLLPAHSGVEDHEIAVRSHDVPTSRKT